MTLKVYLAGGMKSGWQDYVIESCEGLDVEFFDPRTSGCTAEEDYTAWDLEKANESDCLFCYMEIDNPGGHGMMVEMGYCASPTLWYKIFVEDKGDHRSPYYGMARMLCNESFIGLAPAVEALKAWIVKSSG
jgi:hypothetical protein